MKRWLKDESGATAIEYALLAALMSLAVIAAVRTIGTTTSSSLSQISSGFTASR